MLTILEQLEHAFKDAARFSYPELSEECSIEITQSTQEKFGHYQCNAAMKLSKVLKQNPRSIAEKLIENFPSRFNGIDSMELAGPGFINITLKNQYLNDYLQEMLNDPHLGIERSKKLQKVIIDFSSPNTAKEMHVGHLRSTIIGDSIARLYEFLGHDVLRVNHIGDWGTSFGMLIAYLREEHPEIVTGTRNTDLEHLVQWYKLSKLKFDTDLDFKRRAQQEVVKLQSGDIASIQAWEIICEISRKAYQEIYDLLDIHLIERGESFYNPYLPKIVEDLESKGLVSLSDGAKCIFIEGFRNREGEILPLMIQKSDGGYNYDTTDMAAIWYRIEVEQGNHLIYVTDAGQSTHFQMIFKAAEMAGYLDPLKVKVDHVPFGLVLGPDGKKFRTRSGETERLADLIQAAINQAEAILTERSPEMAPEERKHLGHVLGIGAIKYSDLSCHRMSDYTFSYERMLRFEGNTAAFVLYSFVRVAGIKRKVDVSIGEILKSSKIQLEHPSEIQLGLHLAQFGEALFQAADDLLPNRITDYAFRLAEKFNSFFRDCRVEGSPQQNQRLLLCELTARVLKQSLEILGLNTVEKM